MPIPPIHVPSRTSPFLVSRRSRFLPSHCRLLPGAKLVSPYLVPPRLPMGRTARGFRNGLRACIPPLAPPTPSPFRLGPHKDSSSSAVVGRATSAVHVGDGILELQTPRYARPCLDRIDGFAGRRADWRGANSHPVHRVADLARAFDGVISRIALTRDEALRKGVGAGRGNFWKSDPGHAQRSAFSKHLL